MASNVSSRPLGPTFISPEEIIEQHKAGTISERQAIVALARQVIELRDLLRDVMEAHSLWSGR